MKDVTKQFHDYCTKSKTKIAKKVLNIINKDMFCIYRNGEEMILESNLNCYCPDYVYYFFKRHIKKI